MLQSAKISPSETTQAPLTTNCLAVNRDKLGRLRDSLSARQRDLIDLLPLLFHTNHRMLPGYVSNRTPCGVQDYAPEERSLRAANRLLASFRYEPGLTQKLSIKGLYLMGSPGTVGYSKTSDLDIWLVHSPELTAVELAELTTKTRNIEVHAASIGLEVHFFVFRCIAFSRW